MTYLNVEEVETAIARAAGPPNAGFTELITLSKQTGEARTCHAIRVHHGAAVQFDSSAPVVMPADPCREIYGAGATVHRCQYDHDYRE